MRFPKLYYTLCATAICAGILSAHAQADDNAAQAAARAAVLQKMQEMNAATDTNTPVAAPAPAPAPVVTVPAAPAPVQPAAVAPVITPAAPVAPAPVIETSDTGDNPAQAAARAALIQKSVDLDTQRIGAAPTPSAAAPTPAPATVPPALVATPVPVVPAPVEYHPIVGPALPISTDQQSQLQALDAKYYANQISPLDYFTQREAILKGQ
jgi:hypothetical protein